MYDAVVAQLETQRERGDVFAHGYEKLKRELAKKDAVIEEQGREIVALDRRIGSLERALERANEYSKTIGRRLKQAVESLPANTAENLKKIWREERN
jgi:predicted RNase H-like nuclease (RuvC/YqgF family)